MQTKTCTRCKSTLPIEQFYFNGNNRRKSACKDCSKKSYRAYRVEHSESLKAQWREASKKYHTYDNRRNRTLAKYGMNQDSYNDLYNKQNGACAICSRAITLVIDHDHDTGIVRGLLCNACNLALGYFDDDTKRMLSAIEYIMRG